MKIVVSPKACALATYLWQLCDEDPHRAALGVTARDVETAAALAIATDTVYRAVVELDRLGAVRDCGVSRSTGARRVIVVAGHWLFDALAMTGSEAA